IRRLGALPRNSRRSRSRDVRAWDRATSIPAIWSRRGDSLSSTPGTAGHRRMRWGERRGRRRRADGKEADGTEADGTEADGTEADGTEADRREADSREAD